MTLALGIEPGGVPEQKADTSQRFISLRQSPETASALGSCMADEE